MLEGFMKTLSSSLEAVLKDAFSKSGKDANSSEIQSILKEVVQELSSSIIKNATSGVPTPNGLQSPQKDGSYALIEKALQKLEEKTQVKLNINPNTIASKIPTSVISATKDTTNAISSIKDIYNEIKRAVDLMVSKRQSGGGVGVSDIATLTSSLSKVIEDGKALLSHVSKVKESAPNILPESKEALKGLTDSIDALRTDITNKIGDVQRQAKDDPLSILKEAMSSVTKSINSSPALEGTKLADIASKIQDNSSNIEDLTKGLNSVVDEVKKGVSDKSIKIEN
jgi:hypothetical protein